MTERDSRDAGTISFNGLNGTSGGYLLSPLAKERFGRIVAGLGLDEDRHAILKDWAEGRTSGDPKRAPSVDVTDPGDLGETGWGIVFAESTPAEVRRALEPLLDRRREQAGPLYRELTVPSGVTRNSFFTRLSIKPGTSATSPELPYYLLLVGDPKDVSFRFQSELDIQYAVGRLHFDGPDAAARFGAYAQAVVDAEEGAWQRPRALTFFAVENPGDRATQRTAKDLVAPLREALRLSRSSWRTDLVAAPKATRKLLRRLLGGPETPAILFTASHGVGFELDDPRQLDAQGALVCQDWGGPSELVNDHHYFTATDLAADADLHGTIVFHFACYSAGTPEHDEFAQHALGAPRRIAPHPFVARLPNGLLEKGALAVIGHVDRAWTSSFTWNGEGGHIQIYNEVLKLLMDGLPLGWAMERMGIHAADQALALHDLREDLAFLRPVHYETFSDLWRATNDARNFVVLGDPAVRVVVD